MKNRLALFMILSVVGPAAAGAKTMVLEGQPTVNFAAEQGLCDIFTVCSYWHGFDPYCSVWHVVYCGPVEATVADGGKKPPTQLVLEGEKETRRGVITRLAPQYHLTSGAILEPVGPWNARNAGGEIWVEARPIAKVEHTVANWDDRNRDNLVGAGDIVYFADGTQAEISAVRLGVHLDVRETTPRK